MSALGVTAKLVLFAELIAIAIGMLTGVVSAVRQYSMFDYSITGIAFVLFSMPLFCIAIMLKSIAPPLNNWLQSIGFGRWITTAGPPTSGYTGGFWHVIYQFTGVYVLPVICLFAISFALYSRFQRGSMLDVLNSDYVRTAQAKGLSQSRVIFRHAFRNALIPLTTFAAIDIGAVAGGLIITEQIFGYQGMGLYFIQNYSNADYPALLPWIMIVIGFVVLFNLLADLSYAWLDPRIRVD
jgi:ABC-type dipeptide/oligopeptide/nickel transport system permease component